MKHLLSILLLFILSFSSKAQQNLVPNPSFEDTVYCPNATNQIDACQHWLNFGNSPDYFNACDPTGLNVPNSSFGFQYAHSGNGMAGVITYRRPNLPTGPNYREFIGCQLSSPLIIGQKYYFSFYVNFANTNNISIASNKIGLNFSTVQYNSTQIPSLTNFSHLYTDSILKDSVNWIFLTNSFIADSTYQYILLGSFFDDNHTDTVNIGTLPNANYYYIDDVCVTSDSLYNNLWTGIKKNEPNNLYQIRIFPNPTFLYLYIENAYLIEKIIIHNTLGEIVYSLNTTKESNLKIDVSTLINGPYLITFINKNTTFKSKFLVNH
jgi:hypothetical protein